MAKQQLQRVTSLYGAGDFPQSFYDKLLKTCDQLGATRGILSVGVLDENRISNFQPTGWGRNGVVDLSPTPEQIKLAIGLSGSDKVAAVHHKLWIPLVDAMVQKAAQLLEEADLVDSQAIFAVGVKTGHSKPLELLIREMKKRKPHMHAMGLSVLPDQATKRDHIGDGYHLWLKLRHQGLVYSTILVDNCGPFALAHTLDRQDEFLAVGLSSLLLAQLFNPRSMSLAEVARSLGQYGPFVGVSFWSQPIQPSRQVFGWPALTSLLRPFVNVPPRGYSRSVQTIVTEAQLATKQALHNPRARAIDERINKDHPFYLLYTIPIHPIEGRKWVEISSAITHWLANKYRRAVPLYAPGSGISLDGRANGYQLQVTALWPMAEQPKPIKEILASPHVQGERHENGNSKRDGRTRPIEIVPPQPVRLPVASRGRP